MMQPEHVAIIMDGNGRWAKTRNHNRVYGHIRGAKVAYNLIKHCANTKLKHLTLFAFSTENWKRPQTEISLLMSLLIKHLRKEQETLINNNIKFLTIGDISQLPEKVQELINETKSITQNNTGLKLTFALNYGGKQDIISAVQSIAQAYKDGKIEKTDINEVMFPNYMPSFFLPPPDLIIRTSNEKRLSNFFLWQSAYSEFYFSKKFWPDFTDDDYNDALLCFSKRERRFGKIASTSLNTSVDING